jgi:hypothetical protein
MSKIVEFTMGKGRTVRPSEGEEWVRKHLELTIRLPEQCTDEGFREALTRAEYMIDNWLGEPEAPQVPQFNSEELMKHEWKGKKTGEGQYAKGSVAWGWDFQDKFPPEVIKVLEKGPLMIDNYEFSLVGTIVQTKEKDKKKKK